MTYIHRSLESVVTQASEWFPVILVIGSRQVGKTTMLRHLMQGSTRSYVTLDDLTERSLAKKDPIFFFKRTRRRFSSMKFSMRRNSFLRLNEPPIPEPNPGPFG